MVMYQMMSSEGERTMIKVDGKAEGFQGIPKGCKEFTNDIEVIPPNLTQTNRAKSRMNWKGEEPLQQNHHRNKVEFQAKKFGRWAERVWVWLFNLGCVLYV
jgi:hypothetical protein